MKQRILAAKTPDCTGDRVTVAGWVHARRDHGGLIFIDVRDCGLLTKFQQAATRGVDR